MQTEYTIDIQKLFLEMMLNDAESYVRVQNIFNANNFDKSLREAAKFIESHTGEYNTMPTIEQVNAATNSKLKAVKEVSDGHYEWFLDEFEKFTRRQELERAILKSADLLEKVKTSTFSGEDDASHHDLMLLSFRVKLKKMNV